jgi:hypothetical protein
MLLLLLLLILTLPAIVVVVIVIGVRLVWVIVIIVVVGTMILVRRYFTRFALALLSRFGSFDARTGWTHCLLFAAVAVSAPLTVR